MEPTQAFEILFSYLIHQSNTLISIPHVTLLVTVIIGFTIPLALYLVILDIWRCRKSNPRQAKDLKHISRGYITSLYGEVASFFEQILRHVRNQLRMLRSKHDNRYTLNHDSTHPDSPDTELINAHKTEVHDLQELRDLIESISQEGRDDDTDSKKSLSHSARVTDFYMWLLATDETPRRKFRSQDNDGRYNNITSGSDVDIDSEIDAGSPISSSELQQWASLADVRTCRLMVVEDRGSKQQMKQRPRSYNMEAVRDWLVSV